MERPVRLVFCSVVAVSALALFGFALPSQAAMIPGLFNTGAGLGDGASDSNWAMVSPSQQAVVINSASIPGTWLPNTSDSRWIWETATGVPVNVTRTFRTTFDLTGFDPATATITGRWSADNTGVRIIFNGVDTGQTASGFTAWYAFALTSNLFVSGINTLDFVVQDVGFISGFRAEFLTSSIQPVPLPAAAWLLLSGLVGFGALGRRRSTTGV